MPFRSKSTRATAGCCARIKNVLAGACDQVWCGLAVQPLQLGLGCDVDAHRQTVAQSTERNGLMGRELLD